VIGGTEQIGWRGIDRCTTIDSPYNAGKDFLTFHDASESWSVLTPGTFAVYFPEDAHAPMVADGTVHKVVIKIAL
jgi:beta-galactosidase beta subunit